MDTKEIKLEGASIGIRATSTDGTIGQWEYYLISTIDSINSVRNDDLGIVLPATNQKKNKYPFDDQLRIRIDFNNNRSEIDFDIQEVSNQAGWTANAAGLAQAIEDINGWITSATPGTATAVPASGTAVFINTLSFHQIPVGAFDISVSNLGAGAADVDGTVLPSGVTFNFAGITEEEIEVDGDGTENLFIKYMI